MQNLPEDATEAELRQLFQPVGGLKAIMVPRRSCDAPQIGKGAEGGHAFGYAHLVRRYSGCGRCWYAACAVAGQQQAADWTVRAICQHVKVSQDAAVATSPSLKQTALSIPFNPTPRLLLSPPQTAATTLLRNSRVRKPLLR